MEQNLLTPVHPWTQALTALDMAELSLCFYPRMRLSPNMIRDIVADFTGEVWIWANTNQRDIFRLGGKQFELRMLKVIGEATGGPVAVILNVDAAVSVPRKAGRIAPRKVTIESIRLAGPCDLEELLERARGHGKRAADDHRRGLSGLDDVRAHGALQKDVLRQYGELRSLIDIMAQRPEEAELTVAGTVLDRVQDRRRRLPTFTIQVASNGTDLQYKRVQVVRHTGQLHITRTLKSRSNVLDVVQPDGWTPREGEQVRVELVKPFGMRQNAQALSDFLSGDVEGSWEDLARLLCRVESLAAPAHFDPPSFFYCDTDRTDRVAVLDDDQRAAVAGALASPHAFFIQGPPGTGKSEVICETVRQLVGRGERVLLLAPSHVAVDEVLTRVGGKPGMRPYRITHDDEKVADEAQRYLLANLGVDFTERILRGRGASRAAQWEAEAERVQRQLAALSLFVSTQESLHGKEAELRQAQSSVEAAAHDLAQQAEAARSEESQLQQAMETLAIKVVDADSRHEQAWARHAAVRSELAGSLPDIRAAARVFALAAEAALAAWADRERTAAAFADWENSFASRDREVRSAQARAAAKLDEAAGAHAQAVRWADHLEEQLRQAEQRRSGSDRLADLFGVGELARRRAELDAAREKQRLWQDAARIAWDAAAAANNRLAGWNREAGTGGPQLRQDRDHAASIAAQAEQIQRTAFNAFFVSASRAGIPLATFESWPEYGRLASVLDRAITGVWDDDGPVAPLTGIERLDHDLARLVSAREEARGAALRQTGVLDWYQEAVRKTESANGWNAAQHERLQQRHEEALAEAESRMGAVAVARAAHDRIVRSMSEPMTPEREQWLNRRGHVLEHLPRLETLWTELVAERPEEQLIDDIRTSLVRATNLVCATTRGIVGRGSELVRHTDYDTLIVDEASRVTESEFLIGAVKARRWILVGDEHQLPPHVDQKDEFFLHALTALHRVERNASPTLAQAVEDLAVHWARQEDSHKFRVDSVIEVATKLHDNDLWFSSFRARFAEAHSRFVQARRPEHDPDLALLAAMLRYLVQSLFQRAVGKCPPQLRQPLRWQRRMIEPLARIVNEPIYDGRYLSPAPEILARLGVTPLVTTGTLSRPAIFFDTSRYRDAEESEAGHGFVNKREQEVIGDLCQMYEEQLRADPHGSPVSVSVLAFYRAQARALSNRLRAMDTRMLQWRVIDVIDRIQGQQADLVIVSFTRATSKSVGPRYGQWLKDVRRLNVACTRARRGLALVGHGATLRQMAKVREGRATRADRFYQNLFELIEDDSIFLRMYST